VVEAKNARRRVIKVAVTIEIKRRRNV